MSKISRLPTDEEVQTAWNDRGLSKTETPALKSVLLHNLIELATGGRLRGGVHGVLLSLGFVQNSDRGPVLTMNGVRFVTENFKSEE